MYLHNGRLLHEQRAFCVWGVPPFNPFSPFFNDNFCRPFSSAGDAVKKGGKRLKNGSSIEDIIMGHIRLMAQNQTRRWATARL